MPTTARRFFDHLNEAVAAAEKEGFSISSHRDHFLIRGDDLCYGHIVKYEDIANSATNKLLLEIDLITKDSDRG